MNKLNAFEDIRKHILSAMLLILAAAAVMTLTVNTINQRPWENLLFPAILCIVALGLYFVAGRKDNTSYYFAKYTALILLNVIYIPAAWLTSPGSHSAMPYYSIAIFIFGLLLTGRYWEYVFSGISLLEVLILFQVESIAPQFLDVYTDPQYRLFDLTVNFTVASIVIFVMVFILTHYYRTQNDKLYHMSVTDALTDLYNRRYMMSTLEREHNLSERMGTPYTVVMIDINNFKRINDTYGHMEGDSVLRALAAILKAESRSYDVCCRYGGDEFLIILPRATGEEANVYVGRMQQRFEAQCIRFKDLGVSLSVGIVERQGHTLREILEIADNRLYHKKSSHS